MEESVGRRIGVMKIQTRLNKLIVTAIPINVFFFMSKSC